MRNFREQQQEVPSLNVSPQPIGIFILPPAFQHIYQRIPSQNAPRKITSLLVDVPRHCETAQRRHRSIGGNNLGIDVGFHAADYTRKDKFFARIAMAVNNCMVYDSVMKLTTQKRELDMSPKAFGELRPSIEIVDDGAALQGRMQADGYLYLPGYLNRSEVLEARSVLLSRLAEAKCLEPRTPPEAAIARKDYGSYFMPELAQDNPILMRLLYEGRMMAFYACLLGGEVRHFDFTWMRAVTPGNGTAPHCDIVYMGRGTTHLYTAWTPLGDIARTIGGLMILEGSHKHDRLRLNYGAKDVDAYCTNHNDMRSTGNSSFGALTFNPVRLRERLGGRWLTADFRAGDLLTFSMFTVHCSLDNHSDQIRLSSDTRYQLASDPVDERWVGEHPIGHGEAARRETIC